MGFYSFINYTHFDNFVQEMVKGYYRENRYHNVIKNSKPKENFK